MRTRDIGVRVRPDGQPWVAAAVVAAALAVFDAAPAAAQDQLKLLFNQSTAIGTAANLGAFDYDPTNNVFYTASFGANQSIRKVTFNGTNWVGADLVTQTDWVNKFLASSSVSDNGGSGTILAANYSSASTIGDLILNPAPLTVDGVTYPARTLAVIVDQAVVRNTSASNAVQPQYSKNVYVYDLRAVGSAVPAAPGPRDRDRNNSGVVEWNDAFFPIATTSNFMAAQPTSNTTFNIARRFAFSSDGQSIYLNDTTATMGGIWKVSLTNPGTVTKVVNALTTPRINTEPAVVATSARDFGGGAGEGDQILFAGSADVGNLGGLSYVVDNGTTVSAPKVLLSAKQLAAFNDLPSGAAGDVGGVAADAQGNLYIHNGSTPRGLFVYDTQGRLAKVFSNAEQRVFDLSNGVTSFNDNVLDTKVRSATVTLDHGGTATLNQVLYSNSSNNVRTVASATVYVPGDFNRNNLVGPDDVAAAATANPAYVDDITLFKAALGLRGVTKFSVGTSSPFPQVGSASDLKFDLNGSSRISSTEVAVVDWKDVKIFQQFAGLSDGDVDMDFDVDATDLATVAANYGGTGKLFTQGNLTSVRIAAADRDEVNFADLVTLAANWHDQKPALAPAGNIPQGDVDRAFAISNNGTVSQYQAKGSGAWSNAANWTLGGVPNGAGAVASLLTKPQDDTTVTVDGDYTVGQLNFDNYFTYTLSGPGTLHLNNGNVTRPAEVNAFAASPVISAGVAVESDTTVTVTYAADTLTLAGPLSVSAGKTLTKAGAGTLKVTGANTVAGKLALNAGTLEIAADTTVGGFTQGGGTLVLSGAGTELTVAPHAPGDPSDTITLAALTVPAGTTLDLSNNNLVVNSTANAAAILAALKAAYHGGAWDGTSAVTGLITSDVLAANHDSGKTLAFRNTGAQVQVKYTWYGDLNFDGAVDAADVALMTGSADLNYDGLLSADDWALLALGASKQDGSIAAGVPEPTAAAVIAGAAAFGTLRRRRSR